MDSTVTSSTPQLSKIRTFLLWALAIVWFSEMTLWAVRPLAEVWTRFWQQLPPANPQLTSALYITHSLEATVKGALGVLAVFALRSRNPFVRSALFVPMALVPPLNLAFQFRAQGFPLAPTMVGATLSAILWGSFLLFKDQNAQLLTAIEPVSETIRSRRQSFRITWLGVNATILTGVALLFLFAPDTGLRSIFPCLAELLAPPSEVPPGLTHSLMAVGTHLLALSIAAWIGVVYARRNTTVFQAVIAASTLQAGLMCVLPLRQVALEFGGPCAVASILIFAVPLFAAWLVYVVVSSRATTTRGRGP